MLGHVQRVIAAWGWQPSRRIRTALTVGRLGWSKQHILCCGSRLHPNGTLNFLISQLDLAPEPNLVKPLQNQVPKYPFALPDAILSSLACLSWLFTSIQWITADETSLCRPRSPHLSLSTDEDLHELLFLNSGYRKIALFTCYLHHTLLSSLLCSSVCFAWSIVLLVHSISSSALSSHSSHPNSFLTVSFHSVQPASPFSKDAITIPNYIYLMVFRL